VSAANTLLAGVKDLQGIRFWRDTKVLFNLKFHCMYVTFEAAAKIVNATENLEL
jgi:hypothetical protein